MSGKDYRVYYRSAELIAGDADYLLAALGLKGRTYFNICDLVENEFARWLSSQRKGELTLHFFDAAADDETKAYVTFRRRNPILHVDNEIWAEAKLGEPYARYIIAHEVGHLVLHAHYDLAYSDDPSLRLEPFQSEESAEWQAHCFAHHFLVPLTLARIYRDPATIARQFGVSGEVAGAQVTAALPPRKPVLGAILCSSCGGLLVTRDGVADRCGGCNSSEQ